MSLQKYNRVCVTSRFPHLIVGCGAIVSPTKKGRLFNLLDSGLSAMKHLFLQPTLRQDVDSLNQCWLKALLPPFLRKKSSWNSNIRLYHFNLLAKVGGNASSHCSRTLHHMPTHAWNTIPKPDRRWTWTLQQIKAERYQLKLKKVKQFNNFALKTVQSQFSVTCPELMESFFQTLRLFWFPKLTSCPTRKNKKINSITDVREGSRCSLRGDEYEHLRFPLTPDLSCLAYIVWPPHCCQTTECSCVLNAKNSPFPSLSLAYEK